MKSKGRVTYWAGRFTGLEVITTVVGSAHKESGKEMNKLKRKIAKHNGKIPGQVELVRVEVTPV